MRLRGAGAGDLDFFVRIDVEDPGSTYMAGWGDADRAAHRREIAAYLAGGERFAFVVEAGGRPVAGICGQVERLGDPSCWLIRCGVPADVFPDDGRYAAIFQLQVDPLWRRRGLATRLKRRAEAWARALGAGALYTHTAAANAHVIELNQKLGYREIWRGPMWDATERVSLIKRL